MNESELLESVVRQVGGKEFKSISLQGQRAPFKTYQNDLYLMSLFSDRKMIVMGDHLKERSLLPRLRTSLNGINAKLVPTYVADFMYGSYGHVSVIENYLGHIAQDLSNDNAAQLASFFEELHGIAQFNGVSENEFTGENLISFSKYIKTYSRIYYDMLGDDISDSDKEMLKLALSALANIADEELDRQACVYLHKDICLEKILIDDKGSLIKILGWTTAQIGPAELDLCIFKQRFGHRWEVFRDNYRHQIDPQIFSACQIFQGMRFWKSYRDSPEFVAAQREMIAEGLSMFE